LFLLEQASRGVSQGEDRVTVHRQTEPPGGICYEHSGVTGQKPRVVGGVRLQGPVDDLTDLDRIRLAALDADRKYPGVTCCCHRTILPNPNRREMMAPVTSVGIPRQPSLGVVAACGGTVCRSVDRHGTSRTRRKPINEILNENLNAGVTDRPGLDLDWP
jgi:hypothetical protein